MQPKLHTPTIKLRELWPSQYLDSCSMKLRLRAPNRIQFHYSPLGFLYSRSSWTRLPFMQLAVCGLACMNPVHRLKLSTPKPYSTILYCSASFDRDVGVLHSIE